MTTSPTFRSVAAPLDVTDRDLAHLNRNLGVAELVTAKPATTPRSPTKPLNMHLPVYLVRAIKARAFEAEASDRFVVMQALKAAGFEIQSADLVEDARRSQK